MRSLLRDKRFLVAAPLALIVVVVALIVTTSGGDGSAPRPTPAVSTLGVPASAAGCEPVERPKDQGRHQITAGDDHPDYSSTPPTSGWYWPGNVSAGFYGSPFAPEQLLRNLSLGGVVIWYQDDIEQTERTILGRIHARIKNDAVTVVPAGELDIEAPVVLTAWGTLQRCQRVSAEAIVAFVDRYVSEPGATRTPSPSPAG